MFVQSGLIAVFVFFPTLIFAQQRFTIEVDLQQSLEYDEITAEDKRHGWKPDVKNGGYVLKKTYAINELPWSIRTYGYSLRLTKEGKLEAGLSVGDADAGFACAFFVPRDEKNSFLVTKTPYRLEGRGGDYASGSWSGTATLSLLVKP